MQGQQLLPPAAIADRRAHPPIDRVYWGAGPLSRGSGIRPRTRAAAGGRVDSRRFSTGGRCLGCKTLRQLDWLELPGCCVNLDDPAMAAGLLQGIQQGPGTRRAECWLLLPAGRGR